MKRARQQAIKAIVARPNVVAISPQVTPIATSGRYAPDSSAPPISTRNYALQSTAAVLFLFYDIHRNLHPPKIAGISYESTAQWECLGRIGRHGNSD